MTVVLSLLTLTVPFFRLSIPNFTLICVLGRVKNVYGELQEYRSLEYGGHSLI